MSDRPTDESSQPKLSLRPKSLGSMREEVQPPAPSAAQIAQQAAAPVTPAVEGETAQAKKPTPSAASVAAAGFTLYLTGLAAAIVGAVLGGGAWAALAYFTEREYGILGWGIGLLTGFCMRMVGGCGNFTFGAIGAVFSVGGILLGKYLTIVAFLKTSSTSDFTWEDAFASVNWEAYVEAMRLITEPIDFLFYGLAIVSAYGLASKAP